MQNLNLAAPVDELGRVQISIDASSDDFQAIMKSFHSRQPMRLNFPAWPDLNGRWWCVWKIEVEQTHRVEAVGPPVARVWLFEPAVHG